MEHRPDTASDSDKQGLLESTGTETRILLSAWYPGPLLPSQQAKARAQEAKKAAKAAKAGQKPERASSSGNAGIRIIMLLESNIWLGFS